LNYYPNYSTRRLYFGVVETPYSHQSMTWCGGEIGASLMF